MDFDMETDRVCEIIKERGAQTVVLQLPAGLRRRFFTLADEIEERTGARAIFAADPCYGACDPPHAGFEDVDMKVDLYLLYGHTPLGPDPGPPGSGNGAARGQPSSGGAGGDGPVDIGERTIYIPCSVSIDSILKEAGTDMDGLKDLWRTSLIENLLNPDLKTVGLLTTAQYWKLFWAFRETVAATGLRTTVAAPSSRCHLEGQVLGCSTECAEGVAGDVDAFIFFGEGDFHPLGVYLATRKRVYTFNPYDGTISQFGPDDMKSKLFLKQRLSAVAKALDAKTFGVILSLKEGQRRAEAAQEALDRIRAAGRKAYILALTEVTPAALDHMGVDAFVNTACPRIAYDDFSRYKLPILTPFELGVVVVGVDLGDFFEKYRFDSF